MNHGVFTTEQATSVTTPAVAESGVAFVVGAAPVQSAANPAKVGIPVPTFFATIVRMWLLLGHRNFRSPQIHAIRVQ